MNAVLIFALVVIVGFLVVTSEALNTYVPASVPPIPISTGQVADAELYQLAKAAGFSDSDAAIAVAVSKAENRSSKADAVSAVNRNGTQDYGLWQINSSHAAEFGGVEALKDPLINARAAKVIKDRQGWCAWFTYDTSCSPLHTGSYRANLNTSVVVVTVPVAAIKPTVTPKLLPAVQGSDILSIAMSWVNQKVRYQWGGCTRNGVDCSCFVQNVLREVGISAPRTTKPQFAWGTAVDRSELQLGDLVFWNNTCTGCGPNPTHVGMAIGGDMVIHCGNPCQVASISSVGQYAGARRPPW